ncbi:hypothetical protein M9H77_13129 [Catharanthus roseus]|uniref:Uncharacterized protein n=1 Tax=Catharanthus roseus TaxID=4058 RepID=A0ACC0BJF5_CATRO|nr:hypothetical protein M9H77_13129 [Catharanthus roseus]
MMESTAFEPQSAILTRIFMQSKGKENKNKSETFQIPIFPFLFLLVYCVNNSFYMAQRVYNVWKGKNYFYKLLDHLLSGFYPRSQGSEDTGVAQGMEISQLMEQDWFIVLG